MIKIINPFLVFLFFIAFWLFDKAGSTLGFLKNPALAEQIRLAKGNTPPLDDNIVTPISLTDTLITTEFLGLVCLTIGITIAVFICRKRKYHWINPVLALLLFVLTIWLNIDSPKPVLQILNIPGSFSEGIGYYLINGTLFLSLGLLIFFFAATLNLQQGMRHLFRHPFNGKANLR